MEQETSRPGDLRVQFFASLKKHFPEDLDLPAKARTARGLLDELCALRPEATGLLMICVVATETRVLARDEQIEATDVAVLPPMSGG